MKKLFKTTLITLAASVCLSFTNTAQKMFNLKDFGIPLSIEAPENATVEDKYGDIVIKSSDAFNIVSYLNEGEKAKTLMENHKKRISTNSLRTLEEYLVDKPNELLYKVKVAGIKTEYNFYVLKELKGGTVEFYQAAAGYSYSKEEAQKMFDAARAAK